MSAAVRTEGLSKRFGDVEAVRDLSLEVREGEVYGYLGPNGAGKTTTIRCLLGIVSPSAGVMRIFGRDVRTQRARVLSEVGYLPGEFGLWPTMTGADVLGYLGALHPRPPVDRDALCERFDLSGDILDRQVRFYSRGMRQKLAIVQAFQHRPRLAILDEPTEGLDPVMKERFLALVAAYRAGGGTVLLSSHILSEVELAADRVGVLRQGVLVKEGPTADLTGERLRHCTLVLHRPSAGHGPSADGLARVPGVSALSGHGTRFRFDYRGDMAALMAHLGRAHVKEFLCEPESLAEAFFDVYGDG